MPPRGPGPARSRLGRGVVVLIVAMLGLLVPVPTSTGAQSTQGPVLAVASTCVAPGASRIVIFGEGWGTTPVQLSITSLSQTSVTTSPETFPVTVNPRVSPVRERSGSFSYLTSVTASGPFRVDARGFGGEITRSATVVVSDGCQPRLSAKPPCLDAAGTVQLTGTGFPPTTTVPILVDPYGNAEQQPAQAVADGTGTFTHTVVLPPPSGPIPVVAFTQTAAGLAAPIPVRVVVFLDRCPPPVTTTSTTRPAVVVTTTSTTGVQIDTTTTLPLGVPPEVPPETPPGTTVQVSISPKTVRPGRCVVLVLANAPAGAPVVARFADGPPVNAQVGPDGRTVVSVCVPHDSGGRLGPVAIVLSIGSFGPAPISTVLRVPSRPQPPLLQAAGDTRRS